MNERRKANRKSMKIISKLFDLFGTGSYGEGRDGKGIVVADASHVVACIIPEGFLSEVLHKTMVERAEAGFKYPKLSSKRETITCKYQTENLKAILDILALTDEYVAIKLFAEDYPVEITGKESGLMFGLAPRIETDV